MEGRDSKELESGDLSPVGREPDTQVPMAVTQGAVCC